VSFWDVMCCYLIGGPSISEEHAASGSKTTCLLMLLYRIGFEVETSWFVDIFMFTQNLQLTYLG
jgi:hypothetical protein